MRVFVCTSTCRETPARSEDVNITQKNERGIQIYNFFSFVDTHEIKSIVEEALPTALSHRKPRESDTMLQPLATTDFLAK